VDTEAAAARAARSVPTGADVIDFTTHKLLRTAVDCMRAFRGGEAAFTDLMRTLIAPFGDGIHL
jgi:hypothetical protein